MSYAPAVPDAERPAAAPPAAAAPGEPLASPQPRVGRGGIAAILAAVVATAALGAYATVESLALRAHLGAALDAVAHMRLADEAFTRSADTAADVRTHTDAAEHIVAAASAELADGAAVDELDAAVAQAIASADAAETAASAALPDLAYDTPFWLWDVTAATVRLEADTAHAATLADDADSARLAADAHDDAVGDAAASVFSSIADAAKRLEKANVSAKTDAVIALRKAAEAIGGMTTVSHWAATNFDLYATAAAELKKSNAAELAEKKGRLYEKRLAVEAFARSISGGVLLDFDWKPIVNGYGYADSMAGTATWDSTDGGFSTITLTNSIAELWPSARSKALVAHEVGHAISARCWDMFDWEDLDANEEWATAWAIGMGHTADSNGVWAYGYPPQKLIEKAKSCR